MKTGDDPQGSSTSACQRGLGADCLSTLDVLKGHLRTSSAIIVQLLKLFIGEILNCSELVFRPLHCQHELRQFELNRKRVAVLRVLDQEHHQECHDGRAGVNHQLPSIAVLEYRSGQDPDDDQCDRKQKCQWMAGPERYRMRKPGKLLCQRRWRGVRLVRLSLIFAMAAVLSIAISVLATIV